MSATERRRKAQEEQLEELDELQYQQSTGTVAMIDAVNSVNEDASEAVMEAAKGYQVPRVEYSEIYHLFVERPIYDPSTGERQDNGGSIKKLNKAGYKLILNSADIKASEVTILHNPTKVDVKKIEKKQSGSEASDTMQAGKLKKQLKQSKEDQEAKEQENKELKAKLAAFESKAPEEILSQSKEDQEK